jgi:phage terminase small subunit
MAEEKQYTRDELEDILTYKEKKYCEEYVVDWNKARAARAAGYSEEWAREIGYQNSTKLHIKQYIEFIKNDLERLSGVSKLRNIQELAKIAYSNIAHLHDCWIELTDWEVIKSDNPDVLSAIETIDTKTETKTYNKGEISETDVEIKYVKISMKDSISAIKTINEMMGYKVAEKREITGKDGTPLFEQPLFGDGN